MSTATFTLLFTDIAASTEHVLRLGDERWDALLARYRGAVRGALNQCGGCEVDNAGDGFFAVFSDPTGGLRCAQLISRSAESLGLTSRTGVHVGECQTGGEKVSGLSVHAAARLMSAAQPGEVLISSVARESLCAGSVGLLDRGTRRLRGVPGQWRLYAAVGSTC